LKRTTRRARLIIKGSINTFEHQPAQPQRAAIGLIINPYFSEDWVIHQSVFSAASLQRSFV
jgi:hypothetical protein